MRTITLQDYKRRLLRVLVHIQLGDTYTKLLGQWLPRSGRELRATPCFEIYLNDPQSTEPEDLLTDIHAPLESETKHRQ